MAHLSRALIAERKRRLEVTSAYTPDCGSGAFAPPIQLACGKFAARGNVMFHATNTNFATCEVT